MAFTCSELQVAQITARQMGVLENVDRQFLPETKSGVALLDKQVANVSILENPTKDYDVKVDWIEQCVSDPVDFTTTCEFTGAEAKTSCETYSIDNTKELKFKIDEETFRTSTRSRSEVLAKQLMLHVDKMDEYITKYMITQLATFSGNNKYTGGMGTVSGDTTYITQSDFESAGVYGYLARVAVKNKLDKAFLLDGGNLWDFIWNANYNAMDDDKRSQKGKAGFMDVISDLFNIEAVTGVGTTFMVTPASYAFASKARWTDQVISGPEDQKRFSIPSNSLPGVRYDVVSRATCGNGGRNWVEEFKLIAEYDMFQAPVGTCDSDLTGVLKFESGTAPSGSGSAS